MKQVIDLDNWNRKEHFAFFSAFDDPFFGVTTLVDFTDVYRQSKEQNVSFFLYSLHFLLKCVNETDAFKLRIEKDSVVRYDTIHISPTIGREDGTFVFGFFEYDPDIDLFIQKATQEIERVKNGTGLSFSCVAFSFARTVSASVRASANAVQLSAVYPSALIPLYLL